MARQKKIEKSIDVKVEDVKDVEEIVEQTEEEVVNDEEVIEDEVEEVKDVEEIVEQTEDVKDVEEDVIEDVDLTQRQRLCKWELQRLITIYGIDDFVKVVKMMLK